MFQQEAGRTANTGQGSFAALIGQERGCNTTNHLEKQAHQDHANDVRDFKGQLQACGAITGRRKLPWRYRWSDAVRDDVLALNAERYAEEVAQSALIPAMPTASSVCSCCCCRN